MCIAAGRQIGSCVLRDQPPRYRVRWEDGKETTFAPAAGVARIEWPAKT
jgi:hypothetical protein